MYPLKIEKILVILALIILSIFGVKAQTFEQSVKIQPPKPGESLYTYVPFEVPPNTESLSFSFSYDKKGGANSLNFGIFETGFSGKDNDKTGFRGWSGGIRDTGFIAQDKATHGYRAGKIPAGKWFFTIGLTKVAAEGVELKLRVNFNRIDDLPLKQFEAENQKKFTHEKFEKPKHIKTGSLNWFRGDLHAHTVHGDGSWSVKGILDSATADGLDFVALTEHNTFTHHYEIDAEKKNYPNLLIIRGEEVTTYGAHINVWGLPSGKWVDFRVLPGLQSSGKQIAAEAHQFGALASINHPNMPCGGCTWTYGDDWSILDSVEIWNATWDSDDEKALKIWDEFLQKGKMITAVASSDSHQPPYEPSTYPTNLRIGEPSVFIGAASLTERDLLAGIKAGKVFVAENPRYAIKFTANSNKTIGDKVIVRKGQQISLKIDLQGFAPDSKVLWISNGAAIKESNVSSAEFAENYAFSTEKDSYVRLEIRNKDGKMLAFTNPIYFRLK